MHLEIHERVRSKQEVNEVDRPFSSLIVDVDLISTMLDSGAHIIIFDVCFLNRTRCRFEEVIERDWVDIFLASELNNEKWEFSTRYSETSLSQ